VPEAERDAVQIMEILPSDWAGKIDIARTPTLRGSSEILDRLLLASQAQSNQLAGLYYGWHHNEYGPVRIDFAGHVRAFTLFPRQTAYIEIAATDNARGIAATLNLIPREITYRHDAGAGTLLPSVQFEAETSEAISINGDIPGSESDDWSYPPLPPLPPLPPYVPVYPGDISSTPDGPSYSVLIDLNKGFLYTANFDEASPTWVFWNSGITALEIPKLAYHDGKATAFRTPGGAYYVAVLNATFLRWYDAIYYAPALGATWTKIIDQAWFTANESATGNIEILGLGYNPNKPEEVAFIVGNDGGNTKHFWIGNAAGFTQKASFIQATNFPGGLTFGGNKWIWDLNFAGSEYWYRFSADGATGEFITASFGQGSTYHHTRAGTSPTIMKSKPPVTGIGDFLSSIDNAANVVAVDTGASAFGPNLASAPDGLYILGNWEIGSGMRGKSSDGGTTWSGLPNLPFGGVYCFAYAGGVGTASRWIAARGVVRYSDNVFGAESWQNKEGNLGYLMPLGYTIKKIIVPGFANGNS
jgi:hypothetical protein